MSKFNGFKIIALGVLPVLIVSLFLFFAWQGGMFDMLRVDSATNNGQTSVSGTESKTTEESSTKNSEQPSQNEKQPEQSTDLSVPPGELRVHFIDVGQGDAILIQTPAQNILIDGGERGNTVVDYLESAGITVLDLVIGTHPHSDHIGGLVDVLKHITVKEVMDPAVVHASKTYEDYLTLIDEKNIIFTEGRAGMERDIGGAMMQILHPVAPAGAQLNDASIVAKVTFGNVSFLFTGDIEKTSEVEILGRSKSLKSTVLKSPHHGSTTSSSGSFMEAVNPDIAVIMCGKGNKYGHPHDETMDDYKNRHIGIYRTDFSGTIVITTDGKTYEVSMQKEPVEYVGSVNSRIYHYRSCKQVETILEKNRIVFDSVKAAINKGYKPCKACRPPEMD